MEDWGLAHETIERAGIITRIGSSPALPQSWTRGLLAGRVELGRDPAEQARQIGTDRVHGGDDGDGDAGGDQAIFDGRGARLILDETCK